MKRQIRMYKSWKSQKDFTAQGISNFDSWNPGCVVQVPPCALKGD